MNKVNKVKKARVKANLLKGDNYKDAMLNAGYSERTANNGKDVPVIREAISEIERDIQKEITIKKVLENLDEDRELAREKNDISTMKAVDELYGRYLAMFTDKVKNESQIELSAKEREDLIAQILKHRGVN